VARGEKFLFLKSIFLNVGNVLKVKNVVCFKQTNAAHLPHSSYMPH